jgi:hypothetical protein
MFHKRKLIREEIVSILINNVTLVNSNNIFETRIEPIYESGKIPAIAVYTNEESAERFSSGAIIYDRTLTLAIEILVQANNNIDDSIDAICKEIEAALNSSQYESSNNYQSIEYQGLDVAYIKDGRLPKAAARLNYSIKYETEET